MLDSADQDGLVTFAVELPAGESALEIPFRPRIEVADAILDFPFLRDGQPACQIALVQPDDERVRHAAERIAVYFEYLTAAQIKPGATPSTLAQVEERARIPIVAYGEHDAGVATITLEIGGFDTESDGFATAFQLEDETGGLVLQIIGLDGAALDDAVLALLDALDERYPYLGTLSVGGPFYEKLGLGPSSVFE
jgi:hypothetical protein